MKKRFLAIALSALIMSTFSLNAFADAPNASVVFGSDKSLAFTGSLNASPAPGETVENIIQLENKNDNTADFYMSTKVLQSLEDSSALARGAGYEVKMTIGDKVLYDSAMGGYSADGTGSSNGLGGMNGSVKDAVLLATLPKGQTKDLKISFYLDGEGLDSSKAVDYANAVAKLEFEFKAGYDDPTEPETVYKVITKKGEERYVTIVDEVIPLAPQTGDTAMIGLAVLVLAVGIVLVVFAMKRKAKEA